MNEATPAGDLDLTGLLVAATGGQRTAMDRLLSHVYEHLRALANAVLSDERPNHTLQPTALVHEAFLKLIDQRNAQWQNRSQFFAIAAQAMRRILVDHARARHRLKRGSNRQVLTLTGVEPLAQQREIDLVTLDEAMSRLAVDEPLEAQIVEMRYFGGLEVQEIAEVLGITTRTVQRRWNFAKAWLHRELSKGDDNEQV